MTANLNIFMVDDNAANLKHHSAHVLQLGYSNVHTFNTGLQCAGKLTEHPDIIFLAYGNSSQAALNILHQIKNFNPAIRVILLPASNNQDPFNTGTRHRAETKLHDSAITDYINHILSSL